MVAVKAHDNITGTYYYHNDHLGTPQVMTDISANVVWQANYTPFGEADIVVDTVTNNIRFPGQYYDQESELHYNYFRDYDPELGRYIQSDPIGLAGGINTYGYAYQNPVMNIDPNSLEVWGFTTGGSYTAKDGNSYGLAFTLALDSNGEFSFLITPEIGLAISKGPSFFARGLFGFGDNTVDSLEGNGLSTSATIETASGSITIPQRIIVDEECPSNVAYTAYAPVVELGWGFGAGASATYGRGVPIERFRSDLLGRTGRIIGSGLYDLFH